MPEAVTQHQILLIDDEPHLLMALKAVLERDGYKVACANNGSEGLSLAVEKNPDLIICDVMMPPPSGFELRSLLSKHPGTASIPFIFLTARADRDDRLQGLEGGADDYITKPFDRQELLARVRAVLRRAAMGRKRGREEADTELQKLQLEITHNLGHELRTPITVLLWTLELALHQKFNAKPEERETFIRQALGSAHQLHALIEDMMTLSDIDKSELSAMRSGINIKTGFEQPIEECLARWKDKELKVEIKIDQAVSLSAPPGAFKRTVSHLVDNACKFSPPRGRVGIQLEANGDGGCFLTVSDEGPGIPHELREKVFERFFQISQGLNRQYGGLGIGLTVSREIARRLGGDVLILDRERGCTVQLIIPPLTTEKPY